MKRAWIGIREQPHYRRDAFAAGLRACGYDVRLHGPTEVMRRGDVVVGWNRYGVWHDIATRTEAVGALYLCAENGYIGPAGVSPHEMEPRQWYALAIGSHNGRGSWPAGDSSRWDALGIELTPWRTDGEHILVCPNRSFGQPGNVMPVDWANDVARRLRAVTKREIRIRPHPGNDKPQRPLADDLRAAHACVIWSSSAGVEALIAGVPVICEAPYWICNEATGSASVEVAESNAFMRERCLHRLAWAQWHVDEIATGKPFARLIECAAKREAIAA